MEMSAEITRTRPVLAALRAFRLAFVAMMGDEDGPSKELREAFEDSENKLLEALSQYEAAGPDFEFAWERGARQRLAAKRTKRP